jgi:hypothetical protein
MNLELLIAQHSQAIRTLKNISHFEGLKVQCEEIIDNVHPSLTKCVKKQKDKIKSYNQTVKSLNASYDKQILNIKHAGIRK